MKIRLYICLIILSLFVINVKLTSQLINGYHKLDYDHKNGVCSNDTIILYGNEGEFIYSINNGLNWKQSYSGNSSEMNDCEIFRNQIVFLDNYGFKVGELGNNSWKNFNITGLPLNTKFTKLFNDNNERLVGITSDAKLYIFSDLNSDKYDIFNIANNNLISPKIIFSENNYLIIDQYSIYWSNDLINWSKREFNTLNYELLDYIEFNDYKYLITKNEVLKLNNSFEIISKIDLDIKKDNIGFLKLKNNLLIINNIPFIKEMDTVYCNKILENDNIEPFNVYFFLNNLISIQRYNIASILKTKDSYLLVGSKKLIINLKEDEFELKSIMPNNILTDSQSGQRLKFVTEDKGIIIGNTFQMFITRDGGATFLKFGDIGSTSIVNPNFETKGDTIIYFIQIKDKGVFLFSEDFGLTYKKYEFDGFISSSCKLIIMNNGYLLCNNIDETVGLFTKIYKFNSNFEPDSITKVDGYIFADGIKYDSITTLDIYALNDDEFYLFAFDRRYDQNFKLRLYKMTDNGNNLSIILNENINLTNFKIMKNNTFFSIQNEKDVFGNNIENVYLSSNKGESWELKYKGELKDSLRSTNFLVEDNESIYYINYLKLLKSQDYGSSWERFNLNLYSMETNGFSVAEDVKYLSLYGFTANMLLKSIPEDFATSIENTENQIEEVNYLYTMPPYPNPTVSEVTAKFYWDSRIDIDNSEIAVYNITGNKVSGKENLTLEKLNEWSGNIKWNCANQPKGTYLIKIQHGNNTKTVKVVVN